MICGTFLTPLNHNAGVAALHVVNCNAVDRDTQGGQTIAIVAVEEYEKCQRLWAKVGTFYGTNRCLDASHLWTLRTNSLILIKC